MTWTTCSVAAHGPSVERIVAVGVHHTKIETPDTQPPERAAVVAN